MFQVAIVKLAVDTRTQTRVDYCRMITGLLLHSVSYSGSWGQEALTLDAFVDRAADLGYDGVMLMAKRPHFSLLDYGERVRAQLRARVEGRGLKHVCIAGYC